LEAASAFETSAKLSISTEYKDQREKSTLTMNHRKNIKLLNKQQPFSIFHKKQAVGH
jgi:hypothetical protein